MDDAERRNWVMNDESLYRWWKAEGSGLYRFVQENRAMLTKYIVKAIRGE